MDPYSSHKDIIESALAHTCRVQRLAPDAADEFASWARMRLLDNDHAILRKFQGRSSLRTFLITVVQRLYLDWRNAEWGKWRPTADARRLGPVAIELERLVLRDQLTYGEAVQTLTTRGAATPDECDQLWAQLPRRPRRRRVGEEDVSAVPGSDSASALVDDDEARSEASAVCEALNRALASLPETDRVLVQLRYWSGHTVPRIAAMTGDDPKALYRRFDRLAKHLRHQLEGAGLSGRSLALLSARLDDSPDEPAAGVRAGSWEQGPSMGTSTGGEHG